MIDWEKTSLEDGKNNTAWYTNIDGREFEVYAVLENDTVVWKLNIITNHENEKNQAHTFTSEQLAKQYVEKIYKVPPKVGDVVERKWGYYKILDIGENYLVKQLVFNPNGALSYQKHLKRMEYWVCVKGNGVFKTDYYRPLTKRYIYEDRWMLEDWASYLVEQGQSISIKTGGAVEINIEQWHQLIAGDNGCEIIETQIGECDELDIIRKEI